MLTLIMIVEKKLRLWFRNDIRVKKFILRFVSRVPQTEIFSHSFYTRNEVEDEIQ